MTDTLRELFDEMCRRPHCGPGSTRPRRPDAGCRPAAGHCGRLGGRRGRGAGDRVADAGPPVGQPLGPPSRQDQSTARQRLADRGTVHMEPPTTQSVHCPQPIGALPRPRHRRLRAARPGPGVCRRLAAAARIAPGERFILNTATVSPRPTSWPAFLRSGSSSTSATTGPGTVAINIQILPAWAAARRPRLAEDDCNRTTPASRSPGGRARRLVLTAVRKSGRGPRRRRCAG